MFGRSVKIGDCDIFVFCTPQTHLSEVLRMASEMKRREEQIAIEADLDMVAYRTAVARAQSEDASRKRSE